jgi:hypothetical protein
MLKMREPYHYCPSLPARHDGTVPLFAFYVSFKGIGKMTCSQFRNRPLFYDRYVVFEKAILTSVVSPVVNTKKSV